MAARLQKSTEADKFRFLNIALEKKYTSQVESLDRQQMAALGRIFHEKRKIEIELQRQRNARLTNPIPLRLRGQGRSRSNLTTIWEDSLSGSDGPLSMRRSESAGNLAGISSNYDVRRTRTKAAAEHSGQTSTVSPPRRKVRFQDDPITEAKNNPNEGPNMTGSAGSQTPDNANLSSDRIFDSTRAMAIYRRLQRKVQDSLEHGNKSKHPEAAVESTMNLMKRRQQRKMREDQAAEAETTKKSEKRFLSSSSGSELRSGRLTNSTARAGSAQGWRNRRREPDGGRPGKKEAYRLPSFHFDASAGVNGSTDDISRKLEGRKVLERETKLYFGKVRQEAENKRVTKKVDNYFEKFTIT